MRVVRPLSQTLSLESATVNNFISSQMVGKMRAKMDYNPSVVAPGGLVKQSQLAFPKDLSMVYRDPA
jgi:hypothetical protein